MVETRAVGILEPPAFVGGTEGGGAFVILVPGAVGFKGLKIETGGWGLILAVFVGGTAPMVPPVGGC